jgi:hypothetical protein
MLRTALKAVASEVPTCILTFTVDSTSKEARAPGEMRASTSSPTRDKSVRPCGGLRLRQPLTRVERVANKQLGDPGRCARREVHRDAVPHHAARCPTAMPTEACQGLHLVATPDCTACGRLQTAPDGWRQALGHGRQPHRTEHPVLTQLRSSGCAARGAQNVGRGSHVGEQLG